MDNLDYVEMDMMSYRHHDDDFHNLTAPPGLTTGDLNTRNSKYQKPKTMSQINIINARLSYPHIFAAKAMNPGDTPKYSASFILDKKMNAKVIKEIQAAIDALVTEKFKGKKLPPDKVCLRDGDLKDDEAYEGTMYVSASNAKRPQVVDRDKSALVADDNKPYAGCYVNAIIRVWAQDNTYGKRINASLEAIQFVKDGEPLGAPPVKLDSLPDIEEEEGDGDL